MKMTADQLLKIAGIVPSTTLHARLNESAGGSRRTRRTVKEAAGSNEVTISAVAHKQLTDMLTWVNARPKGFPADILDRDDVDSGLDGVLRGELGGGAYRVKLNAGVLSCVGEYGDRLTLVAKSGGSVKESTAKEKLAAREKIANIENPSVEQQMAAVKLDPDTIEYIDEPDIEVQKYVVRHRPDLIVHIYQPSEEIQMLAVENGEDALENIKNPTKAVRDLHAEIWG